MLWVEQIMLLKNLALVGHIDPGNYFITVKFGDKVEQFEIRSNQLHQESLQLLMNYVEI